MTSEEGTQGVIRRVQWWFRGAIALCALIDCWISRFRMNPDGVSYMDLGDLYWKGNWHAALNAYWSPLYGWLTGLMFLLTKPAMRWEYPEVHLLTFAILVATLFCFEFFWRELLASKANATWAGPMLTRAWVLGYLLFVYIHFSVHWLWLSTPDLLVAALVYLALGMMLRFARGGMGMASAILLGVILGAGYLAKAAMLPFAAVLMMTMMAVAWRHKQRKTLVAAVLLACLLTCLPYIAALSWNVHRITWGDSAKINQAWFVNHVSPRFCHWQGDRPGREDALHPTRKILAWPEVYEFAAPIAGTYPVWYDPGYWYAGADSSMHPRLEIQAFTHNFMHLTELAFLESGFLVMVALLFVLGGRVSDSWRNWMAFWPILAPAAAVFLMYMMVCWEQRFTSAILLAAWGAAIVATRISDEKRKSMVFLTATLLLCALIVARITYIQIGDHQKNKASAHSVLVAERLRSMGIEPGTPIALIGDGVDASDWARLGRVRIIAEVPHDHHADIRDSATAFWNSSPEGEKTVLSVLKSTGAKAVVADAIPPDLPPGWLPLGSTGRAVYFFQ
jgi:hypothetical protein